MVALIVGVFLFFTYSDVYGYPVSPLPEDNLITNPWFRSASNPATAGLDGWTNVLQDGAGWEAGQKGSDPSPDILISGACGFKEVYCGSVIRWANVKDRGGVSSYPGVDAYIYQVVKADAAHRKLKFFMYWVNHRVDVVEVNIYGADSPEGEWAKIWTPFYLSQDFVLPPGDHPGHDGLPWLQTGFLETVIGSGYPYYKVEIHARYPEARTDQGNVGVKITGVYLGTEFSNEPEDEKQASMIITPSTPSSSNPGDTLPGTRDLTTEQATPPRVRTPIPTSPPEQVATTKYIPTMPSSPNLYPATQVSENAEFDGQKKLVGDNDLVIGLITGFITASLIFVAFFVIWTTTKRKQL